MNIFTELGTKFFRLVILFLIKIQPRQFDELNLPQVHLMIKFPISSVRTFS